MTTKQTLITQAGLIKLQDELQYLKDVRRKEIADTIKEAISYGDLSENAEYTAAKEEQGFVEGRISELEEQIKYAKIIEDTASGKVNIGSTVTIKNVTKDLPEESYTIVGSVEADPFKNMISNESPLGIAIIGKKKGDSITIDAPAGEIEYKVVKI
ncbi:MAG: transcription elongation factor GreA [Patescibacteria group bacterium]|nr:transcription elongation factor GreA [Patescibacteria group bacterium]